MRQSPNDVVTHHSNLASTRIANTHRHREIRDGIRLTLQSLLYESPPFCLGFLIYDDTSTLKALCARLRCPLLQTTLMFVLVGRRVQGGPTRKGTCTPTVRMPAKIVTRLMPKQVFCLLLSLLLTSKKTLRLHLLVKRMDAITKLTILRFSQPVIK